MPRGRGRHHRKLIRRLRARWRALHYSARVRVYRVRREWWCTVDVTCLIRSNRCPDLSGVYVGSKRLVVLRAALGDAG